MFSRTALCHLFVFSSEARLALVNRCMIQEANRAAANYAAQRDRRAGPTDPTRQELSRLLLWFIKRKWQHEEWSGFDNRLPSSKSPQNLLIYFTFTFWEGGTLLILLVWCANTSFVGGKSPGSFELLVGCRALEAEPTDFVYFYLNFVF